MQKTGLSLSCDRAGERIVGVPWNCCSSYRKFSLCIWLLPFPSDPQENFKGKGKVVPVLKLVPRHEDL